MIKMPEGASYLATIVGIDPGSDTLGVAIITFNVNTLDIITTEAFTLCGSKRMRKNSWEEEMHGARFTRIAALKECLLEIFHTERPLFIAAESPFFNPGRPMAFGALVEVLSMIRHAVYEYDPWTTLHLIDPSRVKNAVGAKGGSAKEAVRNGVIMRAAILRFIGPLPITHLDEHSIDAIAVGLARFHLYKEELCLN